MNNAHLNMNEFTNASRVLKQVKSLKANNLFEEITIIALGSETLPEHEVIEDGIDLYRVRLNTRGLPKNLPFQLIKYIEFFIRAIQLLLNKKIHVVNAHSLDVLPVAVLYKFLKKAKLVYDAHELETEQVSGKSIRKSLSKWVERRLIRKADLMFVVSESIADWYVDEYSIARPAVVLNVPKRREIKVGYHFRQQLGIREDQVILLYQGGLTAGRGVHLILDAFKTRQDDRVVAVFMGYGPLQQEIQAEAAQQKNIFYHPAVSPQAVLEYTASADVGISLIENICLSYYYCMPNKLFEYAMAGLPVLVSNMKDMSGLVIKNQMGIVIDDFSVDGINRAIDRMAMQDLTEMKVNAYRVACENAWEEQERIMLSAYRLKLGLEA